MKYKYMAMIALMLCTASCSTGRKHTKFNRSQTAATETAQAIRTTDSINLSKHLTVVYDNPRVELTRISGHDTVRMTLQAAKAVLVDKADLKKISESVDSASLQSSFADTIVEDRKSSPDVRFPILLACLLPILFIVLSWRGIRSRR